MYSTQLYISPNTLTNLTVFVNFDDIDYDVLDITAFTDDGLRLVTNIRFNNYAIVTIYSPGYKPKTVTIDDYTVLYDIYLDAISEYSNINNSYYCKDDYNRNYAQSAFEYLEEVKANSASTADKTLSNVTYIDSNSAVKTALNGKANTSLSNLNIIGQAVIDGQWTAEAQTICTGRTSETSDKTWDLSSYLPSDNYNYEVILVGAVTTGTTSGNQARILLKSSIIQTNVCICNAQTRTTSNITTYGACIIPIGADHEITVSGWGSNTGAYSLYLRGYRRIGTNS